jgi:hypothetical protein
MIKILKKLSMCFLSFALLKFKTQNCSQICLSTQMTLSVLFTTLRTYYPCLVTVYPGLYFIEVNCLFYPSDVATAWHISCKRNAANISNYLCP